MRMHGALYVVDDLEAYQASPEAYLTKNPVDVKDTLLKDRRPRTEWKYEDLAPAVAEMKFGRSYGNGKQMFTVGTCIACHKLDNVVAEFGPDLTKFDPKWKPLDILKEIMEPSARINEKYQTWIIETDAGRKYTGLILEENKETIKLIENPLAKAEPVVIKVSSIDTRKKSEVSTMPKGLVDKMTRDEILDLIAYIYSRTKKDHEFFKGDEHHHH
jgi:putative heme-binding domain-containing protein